jgi:hypothetical protein
LVNGKTSALERQLTFYVEIKGELGGREDLNGSSGRRELSSSLLGGRLFSGRWGSSFMGTL